MLTNTPLKLDLQHICMVEGVCNTARLSNGEAVVKAVPALHLRGPYLRASLLLYIMTLAWPIMLMVGVAGIAQPNTNNTQEQLFHADGGNSGHKNTLTHHTRASSNSKYEGVHAMKL